MKDGIFSGEIHIKLTQVGNLLYMFPKLIWIHSFLFNLIQRSNWVKWYKKYEPSITTKERFPLSDLHRLLLLINWVPKSIFPQMFLNMLKATSQNQIYWTNIGELLSTNSVTMPLSAIVGRKCSMTGTLEKVSKIFWDGYEELSAWNC